VVTERILLAMRKFKKANWQLLSSFPMWGWGSRVRGAGKGGGVVRKIEIKIQFKQQHILYYSKAKEK